jgi:thiol-disulfide isomerase/thioredoxin
MKNHNLQKGFATPVIGAIVAIVLVLGGVLYYANQTRIQEENMEQEKAMMEKETMEQKEKSAMMKNEDEEMMQKNEEVMMEKGETMMKYSGAVLAGKSSPLLDFTKADYDAALKTDKLVVLYFYANWCPICKAEFPLMQKSFNELTTDKVIGFRVNYNDNQTDNDEKNLAREFGVAYQHTKVFVKNGQRILKSPEGWDEKRYDMEINKVIAQ